ncbi:MAG TPA: DinB family protein [Thermoanaerobaculia bacterium]|nr:DinB family protein [Thermoanaerobaculia bacterium]
MKIRIAVAIAVLCTPLLAQAAMKPQQNGTVPKHGFRAEFLEDLDDVSKKIVELAEAMPAAKYNWRPGPGVRSVSEVYMHVAGGNYFLATFTGAKPPSYDTRNLEKISDKARVIEELKKSFEYLRMVAVNGTDADLDKPVKMFGNETTHRGALMSALNHLHEHLGQSIAYARMNGIVPPWSARD